MLDPAAIDSLHANMAILDGEGTILAVNEGWRRFGMRGNAPSDFVGVNYIGVCDASAKRGDLGAGRVATGLRRLLGGETATYGKAYRCAQQTFRMTALPLRGADGGFIIAHQDITALTSAQTERKKVRRELTERLQALHSDVEDLHEELGQRLAGISLAARSLEKGGDVADAGTLIRSAVDEAWEELRLLRYKVRQLRDTR